MSQITFRNRSADPVSSPRALASFVATVFRPSIFSRPFSQEVSPVRRDRRADRSFDERCVSPSSKEPFASPRGRTLRLLIPRDFRLFYPPCSIRNRDGFIRGCGPPRPLLEKLPADGRRCAPTSVHDDESFGRHRPLHRHHYFSLPSIRCMAASPVSSNC